jgi:hypothetical protein
MRGARPSGEETHGALVGLFLVGHDPHAFHRGLPHLQTIPEPQLRHPLTG